MSLMFDFIQSLSDKFTVFKCQTNIVTSLNTTVNYYYYYYFFFFEKKVRLLENGSGHYSVQSVPKES